MTVSPQRTKDKFLKFTTFQESSSDFNISRIEGLVRSAECQRLKTKSPRHLCPFPNEFVDIKSIFH